MGSNELALCWKDHHGVLFTVFESLLAKKSLVDCTLAAEGKFLKAHRIVLSACSPYFEALLNQEYDKHPIVFLRDVHFEDLKTLIEFIYSGEIKIPEDRLVEFLSLAEALQIKGLGGPGNELFGKSTLSEKSAKKGTGSPIPRKRSRRQSSESDGGSCELIETVDDDDDDDDNDDEAKSDRISRSENEKVRVVNITSEPSPPNSSSVNEELSARKVKKEVNNSPSVSQPASLEQLTDETVPEKTSEEILGLKTEFEQVTFPEADYAEDLLPEESNVSNPPLSTIQDQPSSSHHYSGFVAEPVDPGELALPSPYQVGNPEQPAPEGLQMIPSQQLYSENNVSVQNMTRGVVRINKFEDSTSELRVPGTENDIEFSKFECPVCLKRFHNKHSAIRHINVHKQVEKPFRCTYCPASFSVSGNLRQHIRIHTGEANFQCELCHKRFARLENLNYHMRSHTDERPFQCPICQKGFRKKQHMQNHLRTHRSQ